MSIYIVVLIILISSIYIGIIGVNFSKTVKNEGTLRSDYVKSTLLKLVVVAFLLGIFMDAPFKTYGLFMITNTLLVGGAFLFSTKLLQHDLREKKENK